MHFSCENHCFSLRWVVVIKVYSRLTEILHRRYVRKCWLQDNVSFQDVVSVYASPQLFLSCFIRRYDSVNIAPYPFSPACRGLLTGHNSVSISSTSVSTSPTFSVNVNSTYTQPLRRPSYFILYPLLTFFHKFAPIGTNPYSIPCAQLEQIVAQSYRTSRNQAIRATPAPIAHADECVHSDSGPKFNQWDDWGGE